MRQSMSASASCDAVTSSTSDRDVRRHRKRRGAKKGGVARPFSCRLCQMSFSKRRLLEKHQAFHVDENSPCTVCAKVFQKVLDLIS
jgi:hypothetical protein